MGSLSEMYGQQDDVRRKQEARKEYLASLGTHCVYNFIFKFMIGFSDEQIRMKKERQAAAKKKQMEHDKLVQSHLVCSPNFSSHPSQTCFHVHSVQFYGENFQEEGPAPRAPPRKASDGRDVASSAPRTVVAPTHVPGLDINPSSPR